MPEEQRFIAAEQTIRPWLGQTSDPPDRQPKLWELDEIAAEEVDDFSAGLLAHIEKELNTLAVARGKP